MTDNPNEKVLFELRITDAGTTITTSAAWDAYHADRFQRPEWARPPWAGRLARWAAWMRERCEAESRPPAKADLRAAVDALQAIYDDLYAGSGQQSAVSSQPNS